MSFCLHCRIVIGSFYSFGNGVSTAGIPSSEAFTYLAILALHLAELETRVERLAAGKPGYKLSDWVYPKKPDSIWTKGSFMRYGLDCRFAKATPEAGRALREVASVFTTLAGHGSGPLDTGVSWHS